MIEFAGLGLAANLASFAAAAGEPVLNSAGRFSTFAAIIGIMVAMVFVAGVAERRDRTILRMGIDSAGVLVTYLGGLVILHLLRWVR